MRCPRCDNEWDTKKGSCTVCGLVVRIPRREPARDIFTPSLRDISPVTFSSAEQRMNGSAPSTQPPLPEINGQAPGISNNSRQFSPSSQPSFPPPPIHSGMSDPLSSVPSYKTMERSNARHTTSTPLNPSQTVVTLEPGTLLHHDRYRLQQMQGRRYWLPGMYEANWIAQNVQGAGFQVIIHELVLPQHIAVSMQTALRATAISLASVGRDTHLPSLIDAFNEQGQNFFVFAPIEGESLLSHMHHTSRSLTEIEVIEMCLQMTEVLDLFSQQSPPLVHGLISPDSIVIDSSTNEYVLTNLSVVLASGAIRLIAGIDRYTLSPYTAPECIHGLIDVRSDMYSVLATAYHAVTGSTPFIINGSIPSAQRINPRVSDQLNAILARGLHSDVHQRYLYPSELRQELLAIRNQRGATSGIVGATSSQGIAKPLTPSISEGQRIKVTPTNTSIDDTVAQIFQSLAPDDHREKPKTQLPLAEQLPPIPEQNYTLQASIWITSLIVCLLILVIMGRGF